MYHDHITRAVAAGRAADLQRTAARNWPTAPVHPRPRRLALAAAPFASCALAPATAARAQPAHHVESSTNGPARAIAQTAESVTAKWRAYDRRIAKPSPNELKAAFGPDLAPMAHRIHLAPAQAGVAEVPSASAVARRRGLLRRRQRVVELPAKPPSGIALPRPRSSSWRVPNAQ